jgi:hypothetical protein
LNILQNNDRHLRDRVHREPANLHLDFHRVAPSRL